MGNMIKRMYPPPGSEFGIDYLDANDETEIEEFCLRRLIGELDQPTILAMSHEERLEILEANGFEYDEIA